MNAPVTPSQSGHPLNTSRVQYGTREQFDAMNTSQLMHQVKKHIELRKDKDWWKANPIYQRALEVCIEVLKGRGIAIALNPEI